MRSRRITPACRQDGDKVLKYFTRETGGLVFFPFKVQDLSQSFENIANELRHQYNVLYRPEPAKADGLFHQVGIRVEEPERSRSCGHEKATMPRGHSPL